RPPFPPYQPRRNTSTENVCGGVDVTFRSTEPPGATEVDVANPLICSPLSSATLWPRHGSCQRSLPACLFSSTIRFGCWEAAAACSSLPCNPPVPVIASTTTASVLSDNDLIPDPPLLGPRAGSGPSKPLGKLPDNTNLGD